MSTVISIENLWKEYRLGAIGHGTLTQDLQSWWARVRGKEDPNSKITPMLAGQEKQIEGDHFWALRGINLEVKEGEVLGIIGKNGAGKSTLLKILSRVTAPTKGNIKVKGRIASLLEVGTGFHPELTGRENIFMNGAILGMSKQEIGSRLDEIIDFSGVEDFVDTPVKRYSSGMYLRLAFAVAAHLEPEILMIDEVLAVGDADFQKKCLGKMQDVSSEGRTVLFVSHNMGAVGSLCDYGILLEHGKVSYFDKNVDNVISTYLNSSSNEEMKKLSWHNSGDEYFHPNFTPQKMWFSCGSGDVTDMPIPNNKQLYVNISFDVAVVDINLQVGIRVYDGKFKELVFVTQHTDVEQFLWAKVENGLNILQVKIPKNFLNEGKYIIELSSSLYYKEWILEPKKHDIYLTLNIVGGLSNSPYWYSCRGGFVAPILQWERIDN